MARTPYPITGIVTDVDGSTLMASATVRVIDVTLGENIEVTTASDGSFSADLANLTSAYSDDDAIQVVVYDSDKVKSTDFRHTVDTGTGNYDVGTIYMHWTKPILGTSRLLALIASNKSDSAEYTIDLYDRTNDHKILTFDIDTNDPFSPNLGFKGLDFPGGICVIRESDAANTVEIQMVVK